MSDKPFRTKIPGEYHIKIYEWYCIGMSLQGIQQKLEQEYQYHANNRTLKRLVAYLKQEKQAITQAAISDRVQKQVVSDFEALNTLFDGVLEVAQTAKESDKNLYLRATDRLVKLLQIKFALATTQDGKEEVATDRAQEIIKRLVGE